MDDWLIEGASDGPDVWVTHMPTNTMTRVTAPVTLDLIMRVIDKHTR